MPTKLITISDFPDRLNTLCGQIKRADAMVEETKLLQDRAEASVVSAKAAHDKAVEEAARLRTERDALADDIAHTTRLTGEPDLPVVSDAEPLHEQTYVQRDQTSVFGGFEANG